MHVKQYKRNVASSVTLSVSLQSFNCIVLRLLAGCLFLAFGREPKCSVRQQDSQFVIHAVGFHAVPVFFAPPRKRPHIFRMLKVVLAVVRTLKMKMDEVAWFQAAILCWPQGALDSEGAESSHAIFF
uniref:Uncharacterized protein n=1 Tax=Eimeria tenella TaxID=5802 RepID=H9BA53_EIMTE|nr:hypothetical protein [Eimeria tenella]